MSQIETGFRSILKSARGYDFFQSLIGAGKAKKFCIEKHVPMRSNLRLLDLGCGPGAILPHLPSSTDYFGIDISKEYIERAEKKYGERGTFLCGNLNETKLFDALGDFDTVLAFGILHHLSDPEARQLCVQSRKVLTEGGRLVTLDGCYLEGQSKTARWILSRDRGRNVRTLEGYRSIAESVFPSVKTTIYSTLLRIPFTLLVMECS